MDVLIDLIVYLIRAAAKRRERAKTVTPPSAPVRQKQAADRGAQAARSLKTALAAQQSRTRPAVPKQVGAVRTKSPPAAPPIPATPAVPIPVPVSNAIAATALRPAGPPIPGLKIPFLFGEILGPPLALRDPGELPGEGAAL